MVSAMQTTPVPLEQEFAARIRPQVDVVVPVYNEEDDLVASVRRLHEYLADALPVHVPDHDRRQRQHRRDLRDRRPAGRRAARRARRPPRPRRAAAGRCARRGPAATRTVAGLHGRRPVHRPRRAAARWWRRCCPGTATWRSAPAWPAARGWSAAPSGRSSPAATTCSCAPLCGSRFSRRPVRLQGDPRRPRARAAPAGRGPGVVLRHRAAGRSPSAPGCASTRSRSTGSTTPTPASTSSATADGRPARHRPARRGAARPARSRWRRIDAAPTRSRPSTSELGCGADPRGSSSSAWPARCCSRVLFLLLRGPLGARRPTSLALLLADGRATPRSTAASRSASAGRPAPLRHQIQGLASSASPCVITSGSLARPARRRRRPRPLASSSPSLTVAEPARHPRPIPAVPFMGVHPREAPSVHDRR